ncbi:single-stranded DNA-binding protein [Neiella marina]|uniref:Single-stranded DNA-binding protein n=1 Tax=Neiella holothuriorum TaxID=2870530 RepID=A0ABS7EG21_9GAMM|nr:single-stranded DNA-binding protein [Neiella holothuriorum]MBW8191283.1 single-stranded DNA-binding protein [Neiella holothuriorum]
MRNLKENLVKIAGNVSGLDIKQSTQAANEYFGTITVATDDGYFKKGQNGQNGEWVDRTYFIDVKVDNRVLSQLKNGVNKGDQISFKAKLVQEKWQDQQGQNRQAVRLQAEKVTGHLSKAEIECLKQNGFVGNQQQPNNAPNQPPQGGFSAQPNNAPNQPPQGGFSAQPNNAPNQPPQGGFGAQPNNAPNQPPQGGYGNQPFYQNQ